MPLTLWDSSARSEEGPTIPRRRLIHSCIPFVSPHSWPAPSQESRTAVPGDLSRFEGQSCQPLSHSYTTCSPPIPATSCTYRRPFALSGPRLSCGLDEASCPGGLLGRAAVWSPTVLFGCGLSWMSSHAVKNGPGDQLPLKGLY